MSMRLTLEQKRKQYRTIYGAIWETPRIFVKDLALLLDCTPTAATNRLKEAYDCGYIVGPDIRKKSYSNLQEYMYFINSRDPELLYLEYKEYPSLVYHAKTLGFCNMWVIAEEKIDIKGEIVLEGHRSDYYTSYAPNQTWETSIEIMRKKVDTFDTGNYTPINYIRTHFGEIMDFRLDSEILYRYFRQDMRRNLKPVMKNHQISAETLYGFLNNLQNTCTVATHYYPDSLPMYDSYLFMIETDYEDFIINLFSELPSSVSFFKIDDRLFVSAYIPWKYVRVSDLQISANESTIPILLISLKRKGPMNQPFRFC
ncbi:MAG: hypothetical protein HXS44_04315 [Theionarchaea archaeon]|nr:hypothetical protein [Theionarchaea archaeon]